MMIFRSVSMALVVNKEMFVWWLLPNRRNNKAESVLFQVSFSILHICCVLWLKAHAWNGETQGMLNAAEVHSYET